MSVETVRYGLERFGPTMELDDVLSQLRVSEGTLRRGIKKGLYPKQRERGKWSTEKIMRAAAGEHNEGQSHVGRHYQSGNPFD